MTNKAGEQPTITQAIRDSLMTFWAAGAHAARHNKEAPPQAFDREAARLVALIDTRTTSLAAQDGLVERVARALAKLDGKDADAKSHNSFEWWRHYAPQARVALEAMGAEQ